MSQEENDYWVVAPNSIVWLTEERKFAYLLAVGAYFSRISFDYYGDDWEEIENDEYELWEEHVNNYESD